MATGAKYSPHFIDEETEAGRQSHWLKVTQLVSSEGNFSLGLSNSELSKLSDVIIKCPWVILKHFWGREAQMGS